MRKIYCFSGQSLSRLGLRARGPALLALLLPIFVLAACLVPRAADASSVPYYASGIYEAITDDGVPIKIYRYRPDYFAPFRTNGVPVLLFTGIIENMNQFLACSPDVMALSYSRMNLPDPLPEWAAVKNFWGRQTPEYYIKLDKMKLYSLAHYLWRQGYDPWFANYRDTGRLVMRSKGDHKVTLNTLDTWATLDAPAAIAKVQEVTGKKIFIGGHSTAGLVCYAYLQGCYMDYGDDPANKEAVYREAAEAGYQRHVRSDILLSEQRNDSILGFVALDPAGRPPLPSYLDTPAIWALMTARYYLPLDYFSQSIFQLFPVWVVTSVEQLIFGTINTWDAIYSIYGMEHSLFGYLDFWYMKNTDRYVQDFMARYGLSGVSVRCFAHYMDNGLNQTIREFWMNGEENKSLMRGPAPDPGNDGYYYYSEHMDRVRVPMIACLSDSGSLVDPLMAQEDIVSKKTPHPLDECYVIENTAHVDLVLGKNAPFEVFPRVGAWLDRVMEDYLR